MLRAMQADMSSILGAIGRRQTQITSNYGSDSNCGNQSTGQGPVQHSHESGNWVEIPRVANSSVGHAPAREGGWLGSARLWQAGLEPDRKGIAILVISCPQLSTDNG